jgi:hypothetical protein
MWVEIPAGLSSNVTVGSKFNVTVWLNVASANVFAYQISLHYPRSFLQCNKAGFTATGTSMFMMGHTTGTALKIDTSFLGNGSILATESCLGTGIIPGPHSGSLIWAEFQVIAQPSSEETPLCSFDISSEYPRMTWVLDGNLNDVPIATRDGLLCLSVPLPHNADAMWVEQSITTLFTGGTVDVGSCFGASVWLNVTENVFAYQVALHYNRTQLRCINAAYSAGSTSGFMAGHDTVAVQPVVDTSSLGNGSVLAFESCKGADYVHGSHSGSLLSLEFQVLAVPQTGNLTSRFDISTEYPSNTYVVGPDLNNINITLYDGTYEFVGPVVVSTPAGTNVVVAPTQTVSITFANVTTGGFTTLSRAEPPTPQFVSVVCDQIITNASYTGNITLQFAYNPGLSLQDQQAAKIWGWNSSAACWEDITTGVNTTSHTVSGVSPHLSMFGVTCDLGITGDLNVPGTTTVSIPSAPPPPPPGLSALNYYQISTTKDLPKPINISLAYDYRYVQPGEEVFTQMWMWNESSASWVDITTGVDTTDHIVYGSAPHLSMFGVTSLPQPPNGIAVASANCPKTVVCQGYGTNINVTICNQGNFPQTNFNVTLFCNTTLLATYHIDQLASNGQIILNFTWNTAGWAKGNYSVSTCYIDSTGSIYYIDNIGWIRVSMVGDLTGGSANAWDFVPDGVVDGSDLSIVAKCYGSWLGAQPPMIWNTNCDVNNDGVVDGSDLAIVARHFGQADP